MFAEEKGHEAELQFATADYKQECYKSFSDWNSARLMLRHSNNVSEVLAFGLLAEKCSKDPTQVAFFTNEKFVACMARLRTVADFALEGEQAKKKAIEMNTNPNITSEARKLPVLMRDTKFWTEISSNDMARMDAAIRGIKEKSPQSLSFAYRSNFKPESDFFITYEQDVSKGIEKFVHYDSELDVILLTKVSKKPDGSKLDPPAVFLGSLDISETPQENADAKPVILASKIMGEASSDDSTCFMCHQASAIMPVIPQNPAMTRSFDAAYSDEKVVDAFNKKFLSPHDLGFFTNLQFLPALGIEVDRSSKFIEACSGIKDERQQRKIAERMNCAKCHDGADDIPRIQFPFGVTGSHNPSDQSFVTFLGTPFGNVDLATGPLDIMLEGGHMPPKAKVQGHDKYLSPEQRKALRDCLLIEYFGNLHPLTQQRGMQVEGLLLKALLEPACPEK